MLYLPVCQQQFAKISRNSAVYFYFPPSTLCLQAKSGREATGVKERSNQNKTKTQENTNQDQNQNGNQNNQNRNNR